MGLNYKADGLYHHTQIMNPDGTPYRTSGTANKDVDCFDLWNPHNDWRHLMAVVNEIEMRGYSVMITNQNTDIWSVHSDDYITKVRGKFGKVFDGLIGKKNMSKLEATYAAVVDFITWHNKLAK